MRTIEYNPSKTLALFHGSNAFVRGIRGPIGSGKSVGCCWEVYSRAMEQKPGADGVRRSRCLVTRNTYGELTTTTLRTWLDWFPEDLVGQVVHGAPITQTCRFTHDDGTRVELEMWFLALDRPDHVKKLLSLEVTFAWMNEAREQPKAILDAITGRVGRFPSMRDGGASWFGVIMDTNSPDSDHWWYLLAEEQKPQDFAFWHQPSGESALAENVANLPDRYYERLKAGKTDEWIKVYVRGDYGFVMDGKPVFPEFRDSMHVREFALTPGVSLDCGMDFGLTPAALFGQKMPNGQVRIHSELVTQNMGVRRFGELWTSTVRSRYPEFPIGSITGDPAGEQRAQTDESSCFGVLNAMEPGIPARPAHTNDFTLRREAFAAPMSRLIDGEPGMLIHPQCRMLRKALAGGYCFKRVAVSGQDRYHDKPDKGMHSHVADAGQYLLLGMGEGKAIVRMPNFKRNDVAETSYQMFS